MIEDSKNVIAFGVLTADIMLVLFAVMFGHLIAILIALVITFLWAKL